MRRWFCLSLLILLFACQQTRSPVAVQTPEPASNIVQPTMTATTLPTATATATVTSLPTATQTLQPTATATPTNVPPTATPTDAPPTATATPDPYAQFSIDALTARQYGGGELEIIDTLYKAETFTRYLIKYPSDGLEIYGFMNAPNEGHKLPVALVLHGYIDPDEYETEAYSTRYADALAEAGYLTIHPNFRNYPPSDDGPSPFRIGYAIDTLNLIAIIQDQSVNDPTGPLRRADGENIHAMGHSMGGGVALRTAIVRPDALKGIVLYAAMSGNEFWNYTKILEWSGGRTGEFELAANEQQLASIGALFYLDRLQIPVSVHHSVGDQQVPVEWSEDLCDRLEARQHRVECFYFDDAPHTFWGPWDRVFIERMIAFFRQY